MAENGTSVGLISLDLVIRNKIEGQLEKIKQSVSAPAAKVGSAIEEAVGKPLEDAGSKLAESVDKALKTVRSTIEDTDISFPETDIVFDGGEAVRSLDEIVNDAVKRYEDGLRIHTDIEPRIPEPVDPSTWGIDKAAAEWVDNYNSKIDSAVEKAKDKLAELNEFEISADPAERIRQEINNLYFRLDNLQAKWRTLSAEEATDKVCSQLQSIEHQMLVTMGSIDKLEEKYESMTKPVEETAEKVRKSLSEFGKFNVKSEPVERLEQELEIATEKLSLLQKRYQELSAADPTEKVRAQLNSTERQIVSVQNNIDKLRIKLSTLKSADIGINVKTDDRSDRLAETFSKAEKAASRAGDRIRNVLGSAFRKAASVGTKAASALSKRIAAVGSSAMTAVRPVSKLGNALKNSFRRVFLMAGIYAAFRALKTGLAEAAEADEQFSRSLNQVKANLSTAFAPVIQAVMPMLNTLMAGLAKVTKQIAAFIASLFGMTYAQAAATAQKLKSTAKTAQDTAKKIKAALAGIDEMNILSSGQDAEDVQEGIDWSKVDTSEPELPDWAERFKAAIKAGDWYGAGKILAERVNSAFDLIDWDAAERKAVAGVSKVCDGINGFLDNLNWKKLGENIAGGINTATAVINTLADKIHWENLGKNIAKGLNAAIAKVKWGQLGRALAAKIRILTDLLYGFVNEFDWKGLGTGIGEAVNGWFDGIDFGKLGATLSTGIKGVFDTVSSMLAKIDFRGIGNKIAEFVNNIDIVGILAKLAEVLGRLVTGALDLAIGFIEGVNWWKLGSQLFDSIGAMLDSIDWKTVVSKVFELLGAAFGAAAALAVTLMAKINEVITSAWESVKGYFNKRIEAFGGNIIAGVFVGILEALVNVGKWIKDNIFKPFITGFKKAFGIASPSKEMAVMGGYIIDGLYNAVSGGIKRIAEIFTAMRTAIEEVFEKTDEWFREKFASARNKICDVFIGIGSWFGERWTDIKNVFSAVGSWFSEKFTNARDRVHEAFESIGAWFGKRYEDITAAFKETKEFFRSTFSSAKDIVHEAFSSIGSWFGDRWGDIKSHFGDVSGWFRDKFQSAYDNITDVFSGIGVFFSGIWEGLTAGAVDGINGIIDKVEEGFNFPIEGLMKLPEIDIPLFGKVDFGSVLDYIHLPHIKLAKGGVVSAPTLAMVGDNRNASIDPEVVSPLSKLQGMIGSNDHSAEIVEILKLILELLRSGISAELIGSLFGNDFKRTVLRIVADDKTRRGTV